MNDQAKLPKQIVWAVFVLCALPMALTMFGSDFSAAAFSDRNTNLESPTGGTTNSGLDVGEYIYTILEWTSFCIALCIVAFAVTNYYVTRNVTTLVLGTALFFSGMIDAFRILFADGVIGTVVDRENFIPLTWTVSRTFNVCILIAGTAPFLWNGDRGVVRSRKWSIWYIILTGIVLSVMAYDIICVLSLYMLPNTVFPHWPVPRPWDAIPLVLYLFGAGLILPRFYRMYPSLFSHGLMISLIPLTIAQFYVAFGSTQLFDHNFNIACYLKIIGYLVPLAGLMLDYTRAYRTEVALRITEEKLRVARDVHQRLLPTAAPTIPGFELAGCSSSSDIVGGDYFDYVPMQNGRIGIVVADVSGHEIGATLVIVQTRAYLRTLAHAQSNLELLVNELNKSIEQDVQSRWFVTMFLVQLDPMSQTFEFAAAGQEGYLIDAKGFLRTFESTSPPLGVLENGRIHCGHAVRLEPGDILLLLTDGILEASAPDKSRFGLERVVESVRQNRMRSASEIASELGRAVADFRQGLPQQDDVTLVVLKRCSSN